MKRNKGFTLIELLVVILILAILMAIALPLYLRAVADSQTKTCRANMQTIANALQAFRVESANHMYPAQTTGLDDTIDLTLAAVIADPTATPPVVGAAGFIGPSTDLLTLPQCPTDGADGDSDDYTAVSDADGQLTITCASDGTTHGSFQPGVTKE